MILFNILFVVAALNLDPALATLFNPNKEPFRTLISEANYLADFVQSRVLTNEDQKYFSDTQGILTNWHNETYLIALDFIDESILVLKLVLSNYNYTNEFENDNSDEFLNLKEELENEAKSVLQVSKPFKLHHIVPYKKNFPLVLLSLADSDESLKPTSSHDPSPSP